MAEEKMSITRALVELKLLDKKINDKIAGTVFVATVQGKKDVTTRLVKKDELEKKAKENLQSARDLIERRKVIKAAIVASNAVIKVEIGTKKYTVAEAIERKNSIEYEKALMNTMKSQLAAVEQETISENLKMEASLERLLASYLTSEKKKTDETEAFMKSYKELNEFRMFDPVQIRKTIEEMEHDIDAFESAVDTGLSESNSITFIKV